MHCESSLATIQYGDCDGWCCALSLYSSQVELKKLPSPVRYEELELVIRPFLSHLVLYYVNWL